MLLDPRHGFVPFAPLLAVGALGWLLRPRDAADRLLGWTSLAILVGYFAVTAACGGSDGC